MRSAIEDFYWYTYWASISVSKTMYDADGLETKDADANVKSVFSITVHKSLDDPTTNQINVNMLA